MTDPSTARLTIDLDALAHNFHVLAAAAAGSEVAPVVKADAYGLGAGPVARRLWIEGARRFFVARLSEGEALRTALGPDRPGAIYVLDGLTAGASARMEHAGLTPVLSSIVQVTAATAWAAGRGRSLGVALQVDTGMNRQGLSLADAQALAQAPDRLRGLNIDLVVSHLGSATEAADSRNARQLACFHEARALFPDARASLSASAGIFLGKDYHFDVVRPGVSLYGGGPYDRPDSRLKAVATLSAPILDIRRVPPGEIVGYGSNPAMPTPARVAVVAAGYADGLIRQTRRSGQAWFAGALRPLLSVDMDLTVIDLGDVTAGVGAPVELLGPHVQLDDVAAAGGTIAHEVLVRLGRRAEQIYVGEA